MKPIEKKIIQYLIKTNNKPEFAAEISRKINTNRGDITKYCKALKEDGVLVSVDKHVKSRGETPHYSVNESIDILHIIGKDISLNVLAECMQLKCYRDLIPEIIELFDKRLKEHFEKFLSDSAKEFEDQYGISTPESYKELREQYRKLLSDFDKKLLQIQLRYTASGLMFILNGDYDSICDYNCGWAYNSIFGDRVRYSQKSNLAAIRFQNAFDWGVEIGIQKSGNETNIDEAIKKCTEQLDSEDLCNVFQKYEDETKIVKLIASFMENDSSLGYLKHRSHTDEITAYDYYYYYRNDNDDYDCYYDHYTGDDDDEEPPEDYDPNPNPECILTPEEMRRCEEDYEKLEDLRLGYREDTMTIDYMLQTKYEDLIKAIRSIKLSPPPSGQFVLLREPLPVKRDSS